MDGEGEIEMRSKRPADASLMTWGENGEIIDSTSSNNINYGRWTLSFKMRYIEDF